MFNKIDDFLIDNIGVVAKFDLLELKGKQPTYGCYKGRSLYIMTYKPSGILEKIHVLSKRLVTAVSKRLGLVDSDRDTINMLTGRVRDYHVGQVSKLNAEKVSELNKVTAQINVLQQNKDIFFSELAGLKSETVQLESKLQDAKNQIKRSENLRDKNVRLETRSRELETKLNVLQTEHDRIKAIVQEAKAKKPALGTNATAREIEQKLTYLAVKCERYKKLNAQLTKDLETTKQDLLVSGIREEEVKEERDRYARILHRHHISLEEQHTPAYY